MKIHTFINIFNQIRIFQKKIQHRKDVEIILQAFKESIDENHNKSL